MDAAFRYANALFHLGKETKSIEQHEKDLDKLLDVVNNVENLSDFIKSPLYSGDIQINVMRSIGERLGLSEDVASTVLLMASKRRLFALKEMIAHFKGLCRNHRNEIIVEVSSTSELTDALQKKIKNTISANIDREVVIKSNCDPGLLGGLVVKIGSKMIDTSIRAKMIKLRNNLKEVG
tara:strand:- start:172 stop:708 length:537 start_codon:yes stop_codon:yes gene_type:complete